LSVSHQQQQHEEHEEEGQQQQQQKEQQQQQEQQEEEEDEFEEEFERRWEGAEEVAIDIPSAMVQMPGDVFSSLTMRWPEGIPGPNERVIFAMFREMADRLSDTLPEQRDFNQDRYRATLYVEIEVDTQRGLEGHQFTLTDRESQITSGYDQFCQQHDIAAPHACDFPSNLLQTAADGRVFAYAMARYFFTRFVDTSSLDYLMETSQWHLIRVTTLELNMSKYNRERAARAGSFVELPEHVRKCTRNPNNSAKKLEQRSALLSLGSVVCTLGPRFCKEECAAHRTIHDSWN